VKHRFLLFAILASVALTPLAGCGKPGHDDARASASGRSFATPDDAVAALIVAAQNHDTNALKVLLGPGTEKLFSSGDPVEDREELDSFVKRYTDYHELAAGTPDNLVLLVGRDRWPCPIPLNRSNGLWSFDGLAGAQELVLRRIGRNELETIDVMGGFVEAEKEYSSVAHDGGATGVFAQKLRSDPGKQDGLYWDVAADETQSPMGQLIADATSEGYGGAPPSKTPYHGYLFRMLTSQGPSANGAARDYVVNGSLTGGFALLAYPATYGSSGIMTFIVNQDGVVWQRDFGADTTQKAASVQQFDPDSSWTPIAPEE
jgi:Protein of unknown function (DUF2950)